MEFKTLMDEISSRRNGTEFIDSIDATEGVQTSTPISEMVAEYIDNQPIATEEDHRNMIKNNEFYAKLREIVKQEIHSSDLGMTRTGYGANGGFGDYISINAGIKSLEEALEKGKEIQDRLNKLVEENNKTLWQKIKNHLQYLVRTRR